MVLWLAKKILLFIYLFKGNLETFFFYFWFFYFIFWDWNFKIVYIWFTFLRWKSNIFIWKNVIQIGPPWVWSNIALVNWHAHLIDQRCLNWRKKWWITKWCFLFYQSRLNFQLLLFNLIINWFQIFYTLCVPFTNQSRFINCFHHACFGFLVLGETYIVW